MQRLVTLNKEML